MDSNNNKGTSRMGAICKKLYVEHRKTLLTMVGAYLGICAVIGIWQGMAGELAGQGTKVAYVFFAGLVCAVIASLTFNDLTTKEGRTAFLMTPGTTFDKYFPRVATTVLGMILLAVLGYYVWILLDVLALGLRTSSWTTIEFYLPDLSESEDEILAISILVSLFFFNEAVYTFGSVAWPKKSFLKTTGLYFGIQIALNMIALLVFKNVNFNLNLIDTDIWPAGWLVVAVILLADAGLFFAAYKKLQRVQVI